MRFHQPVGVIQQNNFFVNNITNSNNSNNNNNNNNNINNGNHQESPQSISDIRTNNQLSRVNVTTNETIFDCHGNETNDNVTENVATRNCLNNLHAIIKNTTTNNNTNNTNNFDNFNNSTISGNTTSGTTVFGNIVKTKNESKYFNNYFGNQQQHQQTTTNNTIQHNNNNNDNENRTLLVGTLDLTEENLTKFITSSTTYDNCVTNQSYNEQNSLSTIQQQRRGNLIKLDLESNYMTKYEGPFQGVDNNSAGCSTESSPVDSLLDDQELVSPAPSSCADLSSPDQQDLQQRNYPRGIINPNYPGFQHLAHTLAEHFVDHHHFEPSSDSDLSEDFDFDVAFRVRNLDNVNIMNDNNNNDNINIHNNSNAMEFDKNIDLNRNKNRRRSIQMIDKVNDFDVKEKLVLKETMQEEDSNVNLLLKYESKVFCERKLLGLHEIITTNHIHTDEKAFESMSSSDEDDEFGNEIKNCNQEVENQNEYETDTVRMEDDEDEMADLSGEDDVAIKIELESIDKNENSNIVEYESLNCDLATYMQQYEYKMDLNKFAIASVGNNEQDEECLTDEDNSKLPTPDILIEHNKKPQNGNFNENVVTMVECLAKECDADNRNCASAEATDEQRDYQPDLIKNITETISTNGCDETVVAFAIVTGENENENEDEDEDEEEKETKVEKDVEEKIQNDCENELMAALEHVIASNNSLKMNNVNDEKIINQITDSNALENCNNNANFSSMEIAFNLNPPADTDKCNLSLSLESSSSTVDIIGDFGKEIEKEIGLIVSGYMTNATADIKSSQKSIHSSKAQSSLGAISKVSNDDLIFDENKFIEHLKSFSKMGDAVLSSVEEKIIVIKDSVESSDRFEAVLKAIDTESSLIPTAIVKPKYQKLAFDERQLPIIGSTDDDSSWFNNSSGNTPSSTTTTITTTPRKVQKHLPNFDRRSQKSFSTKHTRKLVDYTVSDKEAINSLRHSEKDIDCSVSNSCNFNNQVSNSVAIVQPLKKNDMNTNCFDKHLDHSQLNVDSKNSSMSDKHEQNLLRNNSKINNQNITSLNSLHDYGNNNNLNIDSKSLDVKCFDLNKNNNNNNNINNINNNNENLINNNNNNSASGSVTNDTKKKAATIKKELSKDNTDIFDVYNIETALPVIDLEAIETHLMAAKEEEQKRKNDREAIRRRLAMGEEDDYFTNLAAVRPIRKPNLQSRMQNGKNLQICFMNEAASDTESSDSETCPKLSQGDSYKNRKKSLRKQKISSFMNSRSSINNNPYSSRPLSVAKSVLDHIGSERKERPTTLSLGPPLSDNNFFTHQARLQIEARMALAQAKDMAHMQMEMERQKQRMSPITELVHKTLDKVGMKIPEDKRRMSRQMLTVMNVAQLQIIVNELHTYIETLNEALVKYLMDRDDLHMKQDSMLIDIEDITRYLVEKEEANTTTTATSTSTTTSAVNTINGNNNKISQSQQLRHIDPKTALAKRTTRISPSTSITSLSSKKSLVVNGNGGGSVITSISKDRNEQQRLHL